MKRIKLIGISKHGKDRVNQHGSFWTIVSETNDSFCIESEENSFTVTQGVKEPDLRWIKKENDRNFKFEFIEESKEEIIGGI